MVFCFWSLLLSSSAVEAQHCLRRRSPCVRRRQCVRGPSLLAPEKPRAAAGALAAIQQGCRVYRGPVLLAPKTPMRPLRRRRPCVHRRQRCQGHLLLAHFPSSFRRRLPRYHITGPASLAEQISPEHGCSLSPLAQRLVPFLTLSTLDVGYTDIRLA